MAAPLEHDDPPAGLREVRGGDEGVVPAAHDDRVEPPALRDRGRLGGALRGDLAGHQAALRPRERSTSRAAIRPFAPMIPPPGWVDEPHSHRSRTGVLKRA